MNNFNSLVTNLLVLRQMQADRNLIHFWIGTMQQKTNASITFQMCQSTNFTFVFYFEVLRFAKEPNTQKWPHCIRILSVLLGYVKKIILKCGVK